MARTPVEPDDSWLGLRPRLYGSLFRKRSFARYARTAASVVTRYDPTFCASTFLVLTRSRKCEALTPVRAAASRNDNRSSAKAASERGYDRRKCRWRCARKFREVLQPEVRRATQKVLDGAASSAETLAQGNHQGDTGMGRTRAAAALLVGVLMLPGPASAVGQPQASLAVDAIDLEAARFRETFGLRADLDYVQAARTDEGFSSDIYRLPWRNT